MSEPHDPQDDDDRDDDLDPVEEAGEESFPASDPPSWSPPGRRRPPA